MKEDDVLIDRFGLTMSHTAKEKVLIIAKRDGGRKSPLSVYVPAQLKKRMNNFCSKEHISVTAFVNALIEQFFLDVDD
jgi:molybdopterin-guanine dinucleotide biosynthesis protein A